MKTIIFSKNWKYFEKIWKFVFLIQMKFLFCVVWFWLPMWHKLPSSRFAGRGFRHLSQAVTRRLFVVHSPMSVCLFACPSSIQLVYPSSRWRGGKKTWVKITLINESNSLLNMNASDPIIDFRKRVSRNYILWSLRLLFSISKIFLAYFTNWSKLKYLFGGLWEGENRQLVTRQTDNWSQDKQTTGHKTNRQLVTRETDNWSQEKQTTGPRDKQTTGPKDKQTTDHKTNRQLVTRETDNWSQDKQTTGH